MPNKAKFVLFLSVVVLQLAAALYMPIRAKRIRANGTTISLQLAPVDPYDMMTGYSLDLWYKASGTESYPALPAAPYPGQTLFAKLKRAPSGVWDPVSLSTTYPAALEPDEIVLKGEYDSRGFSHGVWFGIEKLYIAADQREEANQAIRDFETRRWQIGQEPPRSIPAEFAQADVAVDKAGNASLLALHIGDRVYR